MRTLVRRFLVLATLSALLLGVAATATPNVLAAAPLTNTHVGKRLPHVDEPKGEARALDTGRLHRYGRRGGASAEYAITPVSRV